MPHHFSLKEYQNRVSRAQSALSEQGLDAILLFAPESHFWLTGYDTFGFALFQCMVLSKSGDIHLLTRRPDRLQAQLTSTLPVDHVHVWSEWQGADPLADLSRLLAELGMSDVKLGYESKTAGLTDYWGHQLRNTFPNLADYSDLISDLRRDKSDAEIAMHRTAAALSDDALDAALSATKVGAFEGDILAEMQGAVLRGGGDYAGNEFILGSGQRALLCRSASGRRHLSAQDQLTIEWSGAYARYHAAMMQTLIIGQASKQHRRMFAAANEALTACEAAICPGAPMGDVFQAHADTFDAHGFQHARLQACGYGMGAVFAPIWVDFPMFYEGNPQTMRENQVFFLHMILMDDITGEAMCLGHSVLCSQGGTERLSRHTPQLFEL
ncbi:M24 family metallopeptidase [Shimia sagamensis]|uniref:Xaa-Pro dipeptidase n=1 Tax=Shimia sagamensis TaxID=1566352 RepID=A0ABY1P1R8_9RHOB|nr:Xaa-Pro peptidase family protein [Shimia sagamensis]SMP22821.1 Xaa-Pro dipeptidase [Shimia sagamensis]